MLPDQPFGPDAHKAVRRLLGLRTVEELLGQTRQSDPFYTGTPSDRTAALWFVETLERVGLAGVRRLHLRRIHYRIDALADELDICTPDVTDRRYVNDRLSWERLVDAAVRARRLGLVDPEVFIDRRNPDPLIHRHHRDSPDVSACLHVPSGLILADLPPPITLDVDSYDLDAPDVTGYDYAPDDQPAVTELWVEKNTAADVLVPIAEDLHANYVPAVGMQSMTGAIDLLRRAEWYDRPTHVLYISDYDQQGRTMPRSVARDVQFWRDRLHVTVPVTVDHVVLTRDQITELDLPSAPDSGATELDALEALHPGELGRIVTDAAAQFYDDDLPDLLASVKAEAEEQAEEQYHDMMREVIEVRDTIVRDAKTALAPFTERADDLNADIAQVLRPIVDRLEDLRDTAAGLADGFDPDLPDRPTADPVEPDADVLYDSRRHWLDQVDHYNGHKAD